MISCVFQAGIRSTLRRRFSFAAVLAHRRCGVVVVVVWKAQFSDQQ